ncbi:Rv0909 family putative TA system antitoxin [Ornithinimicrobium cavernae]|uniref:Rv0909 family putative TA system antitoxin n=1 Tax=Ornithinimicrobium cavernae TaxID=2666047 RepID=UPI000D69D694|nr:Rv0909 family putative TA system antitoxin [Ornithinimicrobium cavernae]
MGLLDNVKKAAHAAKEQAGHLAEKHGDKIDRALDKGGSMIDQRTHGKYSDKITKAKGAARSAADKLAAERGQAGTSEAPGPVHAPPPPGAGTAATAPPPPPPGSGTAASATPPPPPPGGATPPPVADELPGTGATTGAAALPSPVREFVAAVNAHDEQGFLDSFGEAGVVDDWGREFVGRQAIKEWSDKEFIGAQGTMEVQRVDVRESQVVVLADWRSTHANGLSEFTFDTVGDTIHRMTIRGAH